MQIRTISQCMPDLNFNAIKAWPKALPALAWGQILIAGFDREPQAAVVCMNDAQVPGSAAEAKDFARLISAAYPELTLPELARLLLCLSRLLTPSLRDT